MTGVGVDRFLQKLSLCAGCTALFCIVALSALGQAAHRVPAGRASISGNVTDLNGTIVVGATVALSSGTGYKQETKSDSKGDYSFTGLRSGTYTVVITAASLPPLKLENISLGASDELPLDGAMQGRLPKSDVAAQPQEQVAVPPAPVLVPPAVMPPMATSVPPAVSPQTQVVSAATSAGMISGVAKDSSGAVLPGAAVVLLLPDGSTREKVTDSDGSYYFVGLQPGTYSLTVAAPNFGEQTLGNITITANQKLALDVVLQPAKSNEQVNVVGNTPGQVEVENATVSGTITEKEITKIGLNGRNFTQLIALAPGVSNQTGQDEAKVGVQGSVKYSVNGGRVEYNTFEVDGSDVLNTGLNGASSTLMVYPSLDAIQEVKVLTSNYGAQYGRTASGTVQVTTKSGGDTLHGNLYEFLRNEAFNARNFFDPAFKVPPFNGTTGAPIALQRAKAPLYRRQDFGGTIGGPLSIPHIYAPRNNKTFFFFSE